MQRRQWSAPLASRKMTVSDARLGLPVAGAIVLRRPSVAASSFGGWEQ
jgi:hypothetical protein